MGQTIQFFLFLLCANAVFAQSNPIFQIPKTYKKIATAQGDLNKDGIDETVFVYNTDKKKSENDVDIGVARVLYIFKNADNRTQLWQQNETLLLPSEKTFPHNPNDTVEINVAITNNTLIVEQAFSGNSHSSYTYKSIFRYQQNDWFLIGSTYTHNDLRCNADEEYDINFSTQKVIVNKTAEDCIDGNSDENKEFSTSFKYNFKTIPTIDSYKIGENRYKIPNSKDKYFCF